MVECGENVVGGDEERSLHQGQGRVQTGGLLCTAAVLGSWSSC